MVQVGCSTWYWSLRGHRPRHNYLPIHQHIFCLEQWVDQQMLNSEPCTIVKVLLIAFSAKHMLFQAIWFINTLQEIQSFFFSVRSPVSAFTNLYGFPPGINSGLDRFVGYNCLIGLRSVYHHKSQATIIYTMTSYIHGYSYLLEWL